jgi:hypothetical protein
MCTTVLLYNQRLSRALGQLKPNCPRMIIGRSSVFYADRKSKMAATTGHSINTEPYGENTEIYSSLKMISHQNYSNKLSDFYVQNSNFICI